jgi:chromosome segregation ATPase
MQVGQILGQNTQNGKTLDFTTGRYDVTVSVGPSQQSQREEANEFAETLLQSPAGQNPQIAPKLTALITKLKQLGPIGDQIQELLDPQPQQGDPKQLQQQLQQSHQMIDQMTQQLHQASQALETKQIEAQRDVQIENLKFAHQKELKLIDQQTQILVNEAKANVTLAMQNMQAQLDLLKTQLGQAHDVGMERMQHVHALAQSQQQADVASEQMEQQAQLQPAQSEGAD